MARADIKKAIISCIFLLVLFPITSLFLNNFLVRSESPKSLDLNMSANGYSAVDLSFIPEINYDDLNDQWYNSKIEMLIITPDDANFVNAVKPLMDWKNQKGVKTITLSNFTL
ncbi:MAG: hypothetical protein ACFE8B_17320, partial [Candidatus Hermodarchaeota archaeon]